MSSQRVQPNLFPFLLPSSSLNHKVSTLKATFYGHGNSLVAKYNTNYGNMTNDDCVSIFMWTSRILKANEVFRVTLRVVKYNKDGWIRHVIHH